MLTLCMIVKNEGSYLNRCLTEISDTIDNIIIVNDGSTDNTEYIAKKHGAILINLESDNELIEAEKRNLYLEKINSGWVLTLDADEIIEKKSIQAIKERIKKEQDKKIDCFALPTFQYLGHGKWAYVYLLRLFKSSSDIRYALNDIHPSIGPAIDKREGIINRDLYAPIHHFDILEKNRTALKRSIYKKRIELVLKENPKLGNYLTFMGNELVAEGDFTKAKRYFQDAIEYSHTQNLRARAMLHLAHLHYFSNNINEAQKVIKELYKFNNGFKMLGYTADSIIEYNQGNFKRAISLTEKSIEMEPTAPHNYLNLGIMFSSNNDSMKSNFFIEKAIELNKYIVNPYIYRRGEKPNLFFQQNVVLNSDIIKEFIQK